MREPTAIPDCLAAIASRIDGEVRSDTYTRVLYSTDASIYQAMPLGVVIPRSAGDVHATVEAAVAHGVPVLARTSGTSLAGQAVNEALVIDMSRHLDGVLDFDREARRVRVEPGIVLDELNRQLRTEGLQFGPDPERMVDSFASQGEPITLAARINGPAKTAFPDGKPAPAPLPGEEPAQPEPDAGDALTESVEPINVIAIADVDLLHDQVWAQISNFLGQMMIMPSM